MHVLETFEGNDAALAFHLARGEKIAEHHAAELAMLRRLVLHRHRDPREPAPTA